MPRTGVGAGMRSRLTLAIIALVVLTVALTTIASYVLIRRATVSTAQQELASEARAISATFQARVEITRATFDRELAVVTSAGDFGSVRFVLLHRDGSFSGSPGGGLTRALVEPAILLVGHQVTGHTRSLLAYSAVPTPIHGPVNGLRLFGVIGLVAAAAAALVAAALARRFTRPLVAAVDTTGRIASGDLDARVPVGAHEDPEFTRLAESINSMGANLARARDQERQFLMSVSHELRTPLTSIRGYAEAVVDGAIDDPVAAAGIISVEAHRLERLVQDLLDLARLDADRFSLDIRDVDAVEVVRQVVNGFQPRASELGLVLELDVDVEPPCPVSADNDRLSQIVANLVENASSFASSRVVVQVTGWRSGAVVRVDDDGPGIPADQLTRVFDRHITSDRVGAKRTNSGLGLAIVAELASAMGATVHAESPGLGGTGTRMVVELHAPSGQWPGPS
jgi:two-component system OmpR family sensor kinase